MLHLRKKARVFEKTESYKNNISSHWNFWEFYFILLYKGHMCFLKGNQNLQQGNFITALAGNEKMHLLADSKFHSLFSTHHLF